MGAPNPLDGLRRALSRLGSEVRIRRLGAPFAAAARAPEPPAVAARAIAPLTAGCVAVRIAAAPAVVARAAGPGAEAVTVRGRAATYDARARGGAVDPVLRAAPRAVPALPRAGRVRPGAVLGDIARVHAVAVAAPPAVRRGPARSAAVMRRAPLAWDRVERRRLRAAWDAVREAHAQDAADLELVGIYGPVPVSALAGAAVGDDRVAHLAFGPHRGVPVVGDLAFARRRDAGGLVSAVVARPRI